MATTIDSIYAIGDLQGCLESLLGLLEQIPKNSHLVFLGDIINRGPDSLKTLLKVKNLCDEGRAECVLGNHDLHLLALVARGEAPRKKDTLKDIFDSKDFDTLIDWLRHRPLLIEKEDFIFVHAGVPPSWALEEAKARAREVEKNLSSDNWKNYLFDMYGAENYSEALTNPARMRSILNALTRMRFLASDGSLDFSVKEGLLKKPDGDIPWFEAPRKINKTICFGHWSMLGLVLREKTIAVDTGCLWGGTLTAVRLSDRKIFQEPCPMWAAPGC